MVMQRNRSFVAFALALVTALLVPTQALADTKKLEDGATVRLKLLDAISSGMNHEGDSVALRVVDDVMSDDESTVLIKAGTPAWGTVTGLEERGRLGAKGKLSLAIEATKAVDGKKVRLRANMSRDGKDQFGTVMALSVIICPLFLFMRGKDATVPAGTQITTYVDHEMNIAVASPINSVAGAVGGQVTTQGVLQGAGQSAAQGVPQAVTTTVAPASMSVSGTVNAPGVVAAPATLIVPATTVVDTSSAPKVVYVIPAAVGATTVSAPAVVPPGVEAKVDAAEALDKVYAAGLLSKSQYESKKRELSKRGKHGPLR